MVGLFIIALFLTLGELDLFARHFFIGDQAQEMRDAIQPCLALIIGRNNVPRTFGGVSALEHFITCPGVVVPAGLGMHIHRAELPDLAIILVALLEAFGL